MTTPDDIVQQFISGDFSCRESLGRAVAGFASTGRISLVRLFAHVCRHEDVWMLGEAAKQARDIESVASIVVAMGLTLSLEAVPEIFQVLRDVDDPELNGYACLALDTLHPIDGVDEDSVRDVKCMDRYCDEIAEKGRRRAAYFYRGQPLFVGEITKELVVAAVAAFEHARPAVILHQDEILEAESGVSSPIRHGQAITEELVHETYGYVKKLAQLSWNRGGKLFYRHSLG